VARDRQRMLLRCDETLRENDSMKNENKRNGEKRSISGIVMEK